MHDSVANSSGDIRSETACRKSRAGAYAYIFKQKFGSNFRRIETS
jgi:hypothetical protein